jgi:hypothetical protein
VWFVLYKSNTLTYNLYNNEQLLVKNEPEVKTGRMHKEMGVEGRQNKKDLYRRE